MSKLIILFFALLAVSVCTSESDLTTTEPLDDGEIILDENGKLLIYESKQDEKKNFIPGEVIGRTGRGVCDGPKFIPMFLKNLACNIWCVRALLRGGGSCRETTCYCV